MTHRVLIVDDDPLVGRLFGMGLSQHGFEADSVLSGPAALQYLEATPVDVLVLDVMMADMDGLDVIGAIRSNPALRQLPVILLSARADDSSRRRGISAGANAYLFKPITSEGLADAIREVLAEDSTPSQ
jgi:two-component system phosphate regulon response regulator PhoB